jgi:hypothetical protein
MQVRIAVRSVGAVSILRHFSNHFLQKNYSSANMAHQLRFLVETYKIEIPPGEQWKSQEAWQAALCVMVDGSPTIVTTATLMRHSPEQL